MIILACETSTLLGSVAVLNDDKILSVKESFRQGSHSEVLNVFVEQALSEAQLSLSDIDLFAAGTGPGSFTGIRISLNTIKTFSFCFNKPCVGIDSLSNLAQQFLAYDLENFPIVCMINAYKNMVYVATFKKENSKLIVTKEPSVVRVQNLSTYLDPTSYVVGDGYLAYKAYFESTLTQKILRPIAAADEPHARQLAFLAFNKAKQQSLLWNELIPVYLRESEAEENVKGIKYQPLF